MFRLHGALSLAALTLGVRAQVSIPFDQYISGLGDMLKSNGMNILSNAIGSVNGSETGAALLEALYRGVGFTLFGPVDAAWSGVDLTDVTDDNLASILAYHFTSTALNITDVAPPKKKTVAFSLLDDEETMLPGDHTQVLVLETAPNTTEPVVYVRGTNWNATSISYTKRYENVNIQAINRILQLPQDLMTTLNTPLAEPAPQGALQASNLISSAGLNGTLEACRGCTFLIPIDDAFKDAEGWLGTLNDNSIEALLRNHILEGQTIYSPSLEDGDNFVTAAGTTLAYATNSSGAYLFGEGGMAKFVRTDMIITNGVVHLIDRVFNQTKVNQDPYQQAVSSASEAAAEGEATLAGVLGTAVSLATPEPSSTSTSSPAFGPSSTPSPTNAAPSMVVPGLKMGVLSLLFGVFWL